MEKQQKQQQNKTTIIEHNSSKSNSCSSDNSSTVLIVDDDVSKNDNAATSCCEVNNDMDDSNHSYCSSGHSTDRNSNSNHGGNGSRIKESKKKHRNGIFHRNSSSSNGSKRKKSNKRTKQQLLQQPQLLSRAVSYDCNSSAQLEDRVLQLELQLQSLAFELQQTTQSQQQNALPTHTTTLQTAEQRTRRTSNKPMQLPTSSALLRRQLGNINSIARSCSGTDDDDYDDEDYSNYNAKYSKTTGTPTSNATIPLESPAPTHRHIVRLLQQRNNTQSEEEKTSSAAAPLQLLFENHTERHNKESTTTVSPKPKPLLPLSPPSVQDHQRSCKDSNPHVSTKWDLLASTPTKTKQDEAGLQSLNITDRNWMRSQIKNYLEEEQCEQKHVTIQEDSSSRNNNNKNANKDDDDDDDVVNKKKSSISDDTSTSNAAVDDGAASVASSSSKPRSHSITDDVNLLDRNVRAKWLAYLNSSFPNTASCNDSSVDDQMNEFIKVPGLLEHLLLYGIIICVNSYLYMLTILPIRFVWSVILLSMKLILRIVGGRRQQRDDVSTTTLQTNNTNTNVSNPNLVFHRKHVYQIIQVCILYGVYRCVLCQISIGKVYHWIRGQALIKTYVIIAMVEIFDRLFSCLGQDCLESLYWNTTVRPGSRRFVISIVVVTVYSILHTLILFCHLLTLHVSMNSADQALLSLLIGGNFAEIKSTVFKKYNKAALFKIAAADICERFKLILFLSLILLLNVCQGMNQKQFVAYLRVVGIVWCAELVSDWIKHSFITKFNFLPSRVYPEYGLLLAGDVTGIGHEGVDLDHSHAVVKRLGFAQIPLVCVMLRMVREAVKYFSATIASANAMAELDGEHNTIVSSAASFTTTTTTWLLLQIPLSTRGHRIMAGAGLWLLLLVTKLLLGRFLERVSLAKLHAVPEYTTTSTKISSVTSPKTKKNQ